jgi:hypothetical protein
MGLDTDSQLPYVRIRRNGPFTEESRRELMRVRRGPFAASDGTNPPDAARAVPPRDYVVLYTGIAPNK